MSKKKKQKPCTCTVNCIYFQQEVKGSQVLSETIGPGGVKMRKVRRECLYDNTQIKSWNHLCGRGTPCYILSPSKSKQEEGKSDDNQPAGAV